MDLKRICAGWLIDGTGGAILRNGVMEITGERILSVSRMDPGARNPGEVLDFSGCTLIPGLIDCHVHLCMSGTTDMTVREKQLTAGFDEAGLSIARHLDQGLDCGVVAVRDAGDRFGHTLRFKEQKFNNTLFPLRLTAAGKAWHASGRYGSLIGRPPEKGESLAQAIERTSLGIDCVKIVNSGVNSMIRYGRQTLPQFNTEELEKATQAARARGLPVMVHANGVEPVLSAVSACARSVEHGFFMGTENLKRMRDQGVTWVPTAFAMKALADPAVCKIRILVKDGSKYLPHTPVEAHIQKVAEQTLAHQLDQIREAKEIGVKIALGTDSGSIGVNHGVSMVQELSLLLESGLPIQEAIHCATEVGAALLGLEGLGTLAPGKEATFLVVKGAPNKLPESLRQINAFYVKGKRILPPLIY